MAVFGYLAAPAGQATYIGDQYLDCGIVAGSPYYLQVYRYNGTDFDISPGEFQYISIGAAQAQLTPYDPGACIMVIPKTLATPSIIQLSIISACPTATFDQLIYCVAELTGFASTAMGATTLSVCYETEDQTYYSAPVNGTPGTLGLYDWVFSDKNGQYILADGYYYAATAVPGTDEWFKVEDGTVVQFGSCTRTVTLSYEGFKDVPGACVLNITNMYLTVTRGATVELTQALPATGTTPVDTGTTTFRFEFIYRNITPACCDFEMVMEYEGVEIATLALPTPPVDFTNYVLQTAVLLAASSTIRVFVRCA